MKIYIVDVVYENRYSYTFKSIFVFMMLYQVSLTIFYLQVLIHALGDNQCTMGQKTGASVL